MGLANDKGRTGLSLEYQRYGRNKETTINSTYSSGLSSEEFDKILDMFSTKQGDN